MSSRDKILAAVAQNKPEAKPLPNIAPFKEIGYTDIIGQYEAVLTAIGGKVHRVSNWDEVKTIVKEKYNAQNVRVLSLVPELDDVATSAYEINPAAHHLADVELALIKAHFGVAENGSVWVTEELLGHRAVPFICQHLAAVITASNLVDTMHRAYMRIGSETYGWGAFIAGPSKTADIEQSLVLGAHGPRSMTVFILQD
ncbi:LUD domain-containing protein [Mucilaginibacter sp. CSA2-8R]|uniref:LutC/YkgG family protein n=1 Tax=Mucilaginibacter sp. CSA2-8R TaxID=3141542 RepID=UPI00315C5E74